MANAHQEGNPDPEILGSLVHVKDCRIWAEISYLDSPTGYREYLPSNRTPPHHAQLGALTMLDNPKNYLREDLPRLLFLLTVILLLISGYLLYRVVDLL